MNSKQLIVTVLFLITLLLGGLTLYLAFNLGSGQGVQPTPTPYYEPTPITSPTPSLTPTPLPIVDCGQRCEKAQCAQGSTCLTVNTAKRCVLNACINESSSPVTLNDSCQSDLCTLKTNVTVAKKAEISCASEGGNNVKLIITVTNTSQTDLENIIVSEDLTGSISIDYLKANSISNNGKVEGTKLIWEGISLDAFNGSVELSYEMSVPAAENGNSYVSVVEARQAGALIGSGTFSLAIEILPCTALEQDQWLFIIAGISMIMFGFYYINHNYDVKVGNLLWSRGLKQISSGTNILLMNPIRKGFKQIKLSLRQKLGEKNVKFEDRVINNRDK